MDQQGMTPQEKAAVMQLMGQTYGQLHKQDQMIVGGSGNLQPTSHKAKQVFEQAAKMPTINKQPGQVSPPQSSLEQIQEAPPAQIEHVTPEQAITEIQEVPAVQVQDDNQMEFDLSEPSKFDKMLDLLKEQNLLLKDISLKLDNGKNFKTKKQD